MNLKQLQNVFVLEMSDSEDGQGQVGGKLIGQGVDGCTFYPAPRCANGPVFDSKSKDKEKKKKYIGKIVYGNPTNEFRFGSEIMSIPKASNYFALPTSLCTPAIPIEDPDIKKCKIVESIEQSKTLSLLGGINNVGITLEDYNLNHSKLADNFVHIFKHLLEGAAMNQSRDIIHNDIHDNNILVDKHNVARFIDVGRAFKISEVVTWRNINVGTSFRPKGNYVWLAPEINIWLMRFNNIPLAVGLKKLFSEIPEFEQISQQFYLHKTLTVAMEDFIKTDTFTRSGDSVGFIKQYAKRFDSWRIGLCLWYSWNELLRWPGVLKHPIAKQYSTIRSVIGGLLQFDPRDRLTVEAALQILSN